MSDLSHDAWFSQEPYRVRFDWGRRGTRAAAVRGDLIVIVDVLSFSTAAATAIDRGAMIHPCATQTEAEAIARRTGAEVAVHRRDVPTLGRFSLSPLSFMQAEPGMRIALASPNGATCSRHGRDVPCLVVGALVNARATSAAVSRIMDATGHSVTVIACGERWHDDSEDGTLRIAVEDYLGAGAIIAGLSGELSPEAQVCAGAFLQSCNRLAETLHECGSGRELRDKGFGEDVQHAAMLDLYDTVPVMRGEWLERLQVTAGHLDQLTIPSRQLPGGP